MTKPPTLYTFEQFKADHEVAESSEEAQTKKAVEPDQTKVASRDDLQRFLQEIQYLTNQCSLNKSALMRAIGVPNEQLHNHFAIGKDVPLAELEGVAEVLGISFPELQTVSDWYSRRRKYRNQMIRQLAHAGLIPLRRVPKEEEE